MLYCFVYPESIGKYLHDGFKKDERESSIEISKYKLGKEFFTYKAVTTSVYSLDGTKLEIDGNLGNVLDHKNAIKSYTITLARYYSNLVSEEDGHQYLDLNMEFHVGDIVSSTGKKLGNLLVYSDFKTREVLKTILKKFEIIEIEPSSDVGWDMIKLMTKIGKFQAKPYRDAHGPTFQYAGQKQVSVEISICHGLNNDRCPESSHCSLS